MYFGSTQDGIEPRSTDYETDALNRLRAGH